MIKLINTISRYLVAFVFIFSGFVKLVDPYGTAYKISDYLEVVNLMIPFGLALLASMILSVLEFTVGVSLLLKVCYANAVRLLLVLVSIFTLLTLYIAIADPVQDCGCFGDALVISNWATFAKNIVLLIMSLELLRNRYYMRSRVVISSQHLMVYCTIGIAFVFSFCAVRHLPVLDFRPYKVGTYIPEAMQVPQGEPADVYKTTYVYEKDGQQSTFDEDNYPWQDTTWVYVESHSELITKGAQPAIHDFVLQDQAYGDITEEVLSDPNYTFLLVAPKLDKITLKHADNFKPVVDYCTQQGYRFLVLTASLGQPVQAFQKLFDAPLDICNVDNIQLKTMVRSRPGLMVVKDGVIIAKYHHNDLPNFSESASPLSGILTQGEKRKNQINVLFLALIFGVLSYKLLQKKDYSK